MRELLLQRSVQMGRHPLLPKEYQQVEYIESTGTQWIDTGYCPSQDTEIEVCFLLNVKGGHIFGSYEPQKNCAIYFPQNTEWGYFGDKRTGAFYVSSYDLGTKYHLLFSKAGLTFGNINLPLSGVNPFRSSLTLYICRMNGYTTTQAYMKGRIFSFIIRESGMVIKNYIPCYKKSNRATGLFDLVNSSFLASDSQVQFLSGPEISLRSIG